jgi:hypothetical protein
MALLREPNGEFSSARLIFIIGSIWTMLMTTYLAWQGATHLELVAFFGPVEAVWVGLKLGQKPMEQKLNKDGSTRSG